MIYYLISYSICVRMWCFLLNGTMLHCEIYIKMYLLSRLKYYAHDLYLLDEFRIERSKIPLHYGDQFKNQRNALQIIPYIPLHQRLTMLSTHFLYSSCTLYIIIYASSVFSVFLLQSLHNYLDSAACISVLT